MEFGNVGLLELLELALSKHTSIDRSVLVSSVLPQMMTMVKGTVFETRDNSMDGELIIAYKDKAYAITANFNVMTIENEYTMGSGSYTSFGSLYTTRYTEFKPETRVVLAIEAASARCTSVSNEVYVGDTSGKGFEKYHTTLKNCQR